MIENADHHRTIILYGLVRFVWGMGMKHELKIWPKYYFRVADGTKTFEVRKNDRHFQQGDDVELRYFDPEFPVGILFTPSELTTMWDRDYPRLLFKIGFVLPLENNVVVFSLLPKDSE